MSLGATVTKSPPQGDRTRLRRAVAGLTTIAVTGIAVPAASAQTNTNRGVSSPGLGISIGSSGSIGTSNGTTAGSRFASVPESARRLATGMMWSNDVVCRGTTNRVTQGWLWSENNLTTCSSARLRMSTRVSTETSGVLFHYNGASLAQRSDGFKGEAVFEHKHPAPYKYQARYFR